MHAIRHISVSIVSLHHEILLSLFFLFTREILYDWFGASGAYVNPAWIPMWKAEILSILLVLSKVIMKCVITH